MTPAATALGFVRWEAHLEVWLLLAGVIGLGLYATRVIGPKAVGAGEPVTTGRQRLFFWTGVFVLWLASDWPVHDVAEEHLYSVHMIQHFVLTFVVPPLFLLSIPTWLARLVLRQGSAVTTWVRRFSRPVVAGLVFNAVVIFTHWPTIVDLSIESGPFHYVMHVVVVTAALLMWMPVCGPVPEWRMSMPGQMLYLFLMSIVPTVPAAWLTLAENPVYESYDHANRLWGVGVIDDQQAAGLFMKLGGGIYLWTIIAVMFFTWAARNEKADRDQRRLSERELLTFDQVEREFDRLDRVGPPPTDRSPTDRSPTGPNNPEIA